MSLSTFAIAFVARPVGGALFGHFGDRLGRKSMLVLTLTLMGGATFAIGLLPAYANRSASARPCSSSSYDSCRVSRSVASTAGRS